LFIHGNLEAYYIKLREVGITVELVALGTVKMGDEVENISGEIESINYV
jgi:hypothetical protein